MYFVNLCFYGNILERCWIKGRLVFGDVDGFLDGRVTWKHIISKVLSIDTHILGSYVVIIVRDVTLCRSSTELFCDLV